MDSNKEEKAWREVKMHQKFLNAFRGLYVFWKTTKNLIVHKLVALVVIILGFYFHVSKMEWIALIFSISFVLVTEALNTAIEFDIDLTYPEYHPFSRDTTDVAPAEGLWSLVT